MPVCLQKFHFFLYGWKRKSANENCAMEGTAEELQLLCGVQGGENKFGAGHALTVASKEVIETPDPAEWVVASLTEVLRPFTWREIQEATESDSQLQEVIRWLRADEQTAASSDWKSVREELSELQGVLLSNEKVVLPTELRLRAVKLAVKLAHDDAHQEMSRTKQRLRQHYWWPRMDGFVEAAVRSCSVCSRLDKTARTITAPVRMTGWPKGPW